MSHCTIDDGPFTLSVDKFVDSAGNTTTDTDVPVWASSDPTVATVVVDPANTQGVIATLTKKAGATQFTAAFGDQSKVGTPGNYLLTGTLTVNSGRAVAGTIEITGPGALPDTPPVVVTPLATSYATVTAFNTAVAAYTGPEQVDLNGGTPPAKAGTLPSLKYFTQADGTVSTTPSAP